MERITALEDAINKNSLVGVYSVFYTIAHGDPNFSTGKFREILQYVKQRNMEGFIQEFDGEKFEPEDKWNEDYWALIASSLMDNFCEERINHLEAVGKKVYPMAKTIAQSTNQSEHNQTTISKSSMNEKVTASSSQGRRNGIITEEQKKGVKFKHDNRTHKDDGGFFSKLFGIGPRG